MKGVQQDLVLGSQIEGIKNFKWLIPCELKAPPVIGSTRILPVKPGKAPDPKTRVHLVAGSTIYIDEDSWFFFTSSLYGVVSDLKKDLVRSGLVAKSAKPVAS
ncbi:unnamed protein product [Arabidopsis thaliana]|uniref:Uncharacterized protein n=1 Tax=Arabidopsis thaliana TaxID=3702 RepID=A0A654F3K3_ARATH|nr:unnamed protein product [Arabidopsis thaliana]